VGGPADLQGAPYFVYGAPSLENQLRAGGTLAGGPGPRMPPRRYGVDPLQ